MKTSYKKSENEINKKTDKVRVRHRKKIGGELPVVHDIHSHDNPIGKLLPRIPKLEQGPAHKEEDILESIRDMHSKLAIIIATLNCLIVKDTHDETYSGGYIENREVYRRLYNEFHERLKRGTLNKKELDME